VRNNSKASLSAAARRTVLRLNLLAASLITGVVLSSYAVDNSQESLKRQQKLAYFVDESRIDELVAQLSEKYRAQDFVIRNIKLINDLTKDSQNSDIKTMCLVASSLRLGEEVLTSRLAPRATGLAQQL